MLVFRRTFLTKHMKTFWSIVGIFAAVMVGFTLLSVLGVPLNFINQGTRVINKTIDADNVIYNYEFFKQQCEDIKAQEDKIHTAQLSVEAFEHSAGARSEWDYEDKTEHSRLTTNLVGLKNVREEMIAKYNARAQMMNRRIYQTTECDTQLN